MVSKITEDKLEFDELTAFRINQDASIFDGINPTELMKRNPTLTQVALDFYKAVYQTAENFSNEAQEKLTNGKSSNDEAPKDGIADNPKQLEALKEKLLTELQAQFPNLLKSEIDKYISDLANTAKADIAQIKESSEKKAKEDAEAAATVAKMIGGCLMASAGLALASKANIADLGNLSPPFFDNLFSKDKDKGIFS